MKILFKRNNASTSTLPSSGISAGEPVWFKDDLYAGSVGTTKGGSTTEGALVPISPNAILTTAGDILFKPASGRATRLPIGTSGQVLTVSSSGVPEWASAAAVNDASLLFKAGSTSGAVFSANASTNSTVEFAAANNGSASDSPLAVAIDTTNKKITYTHNKSGVTAGAYGSKTSNVTFSIPKITVNDTGHVKAAENLSVTITPADLGLTQAMIFVGVSTTEPTAEGATVSGHTTWKKGEVVLYDNKEYVLTGDSNIAANWVEFGDEGSYALKTVTITGDGTYLEGGGSLAENRVISHKELLGTATASELAYSFEADAAGHITAVTALNAGSATNPVWFNAGVLTACTYTLGKSVPSDAVFTDVHVTDAQYHYGYSASASTAENGQGTGGQTITPGTTNVIIGITEDKAHHVTGFKYGVLPTYPTETHVATGHPTVTNLGLGAYSSSTNNYTIYALDQANTAQISAETTTNILTIDLIDGGTF